MDVEVLVRRRLRILIRAKFGSLDRFYLEADFSKGHLSEILRGKGSPSLKTLKRLARLLEIDVFDLLSREAPPPRKPPGRPPNL
jgi:transcriptional regulator with XRE-family HTH domain